MIRNLTIILCILIPLSISAQTYTARIMRPAGYILATFQCAIPADSISYGDTVYIHFGNMTLIARMVDLRRY